MGTVSLLSRFSRECGWLLAADPQHAAALAEVAVPAGEHSLEGR
jgi:hypothetical protein